MIIPEALPLTFRPPETTSSDEDCERLDRAFRDLIEDQWVNDFIKRLNYVIEDASSRRTTMNRKGVEFTVTQVEPELWKWQFQIGALRAARRNRTSWAWQPTEFNSGLPRTQ